STRSRRLTRGRRRCTHSPHEFDRVWRGQSINKGRVAVHFPHRVCWWRCRSPQRRAWRPRIRGANEKPACASCHAVFSGAKTCRLFLQSIRPVYLPAWPHSERERSSGRDDRHSPEEATPRPAREPETSSSSARCSWSTSSYSFSVAVVSNPRRRTHSPLTPLE